MKKLLLIILDIFIMFAVWGQYAPSAGQLGTTAVYKDSSVFVAWANACCVVRGWQDIADTSLGKISYGTDTNAVGKADNTVVTLGDGGSAVVSFRYPIVDDTGYDFAVFENGLTDLFLELAFVEVSSDSINFVRFPSVSLSDTTIQVSSFGSVYATKIHNLAGKYSALYGTPFDLSDLQDSAAIDLNNVRFVRIIDVVGTIDDSLCRRDSQGHKINDPYPTAFNTGGFDLDAIGVIHADFQMIPVTNFQNYLTISPNPVSRNEKLVIQFMSGKIRTTRIQIFNTFGQLIFTNDDFYGNRIVVKIKNWQAGIYIVNIETNEDCFKKKILVY
ncbi:MAG: T9SS type A sorting domain-containing protein [Bacteroidales bacterium]|nr:T9SS type A sorting domain-containing protein [Bacteroidales bacterium]